MCTQHYLKEAISLKEPTFHQHSGKVQYKINYIFINRALKDVMIDAEYTILMEPLNTSSHNPVYLKPTIIYIIKLAYLLTTTLEKEKSTMGQDGEGSVL